MSQASSSNYPEYEALEAELGNVHWTISAAELHGMLVGLLSVSQSLELNDWISIFSDGASAWSDLPKSFKTLLLLLSQATIEQLQSADLDFQLFLPKEDSPVNEQLQAIVDWTSGFLTGFGLGLGEQSMADDVTEALHDLNEIVYLDVDSDYSDEDSAKLEKDLFEVQDFIRIAVLTLCTEYQYKPSTVSTDAKENDEQRTIH
jgi:uncharacterized protein YgfB (UPF0149 family)